MTPGPASTSLPSAISRCVNLVPVADPSAARGVAGACVLAAPFGDGVAGVEGVEGLLRLGCGVAGAGEGAGVCCAVWLPGRLDWIRPSTMSFSESRFSQIA